MQIPMKALSYEQKRRAVELAAEMMRALAGFVEAIEFENEANWKASDAIIPV